MTVTALSADADDDRGNRKMPSKGPGFVPWGTMYKLETSGEGPRGLECVNCGFRLEWRVYTIAPEQFDARCSECGMPADHYWKDKPHRKVDDA